MNINELLEESKKINFNSIILKTFNDKENENIIKVLFLFELINYIFDKYGYTILSVPTTNNNKYFYWIGNNESMFGNSSNNYDSRDDALIDGILKTISIIKEKEVDNENK